LGRCLCCSPERSNSEGIGLLALEEEGDPAENRGGIDQEDKGA
jgi:hypothetical protein